MRWVEEDGRKKKSINQNYVKRHSTDETKQQMFSLNLNWVNGGTM